MIFKYELVNAINDTNHDLALLAAKLSDLEEKIEQIEKTICKCPKSCPKKSDKKVRAALKDLKKVLDETEPKRGRGRPRKNK